MGSRPLSVTTTAVSKKQVLWLLQANRVPAPSSLRGMGQLLPRAEDAVATVSLLPCLIGFGSNKF